MFYPTSEPDKIRLVGIDPGTDTLGVAVLDVHYQTFEAEVVYYKTYRASRDSDRYSWKTEVLGNRDVRLSLHRIFLSEFFDIVEPTLVAAESPFLRMGRVTSFEALVECYALIRDVLWIHSPSMVLRRIDPITVKNYVGVSHIGTDKDDVRKAVLEIYRNKTIVDLSEADEHSIDAIAVAHCLLEKYLLDVEVVSTKKPKKRRFRRRKK